MDETHYMYGAALIEVGSGFDIYLRTWPWEDWNRIMPREFLILNDFFPWAD